MNRQEVLEEIQSLAEQWVKTFGGNSQAVKQDTSTITPIPETVITVTFSSPSQPGRVLEVQGTPTNILTKLNDTLLFFCKNVLDGDSGLTAPANLDYVDLREYEDAPSVT